ncbi:restriction endonuclease subunit S [Paenibacillus validus]|uniref:Restriction endonuclease subunit S n=1 Tax=Paenibacillus validus TaxID=44253 RepID=A0A7X2Z942_9BACL|nr:restriction endonuclease subunit S [Paenibacillus validus]MUG70594.1 restriction endonuclease subunit S [Paenibacillus validus]
MPKYRFEDIAFNITQKRKPTSDDMKTYIGLEHLDSGSLSVTRWGSNVPIKGDKLIMQKGDILFGKRNAYLRRAAIAPHDGLFSAHGMILRPNEKVISRKFFPFFISSDYFFDAAIRISVGSLSPTINWSALKELEFMLPDMNEQEKLADLLWAANNTKEAYKKLLYLTDELVKSQFIEMFGDPVDNPKGWIKAPLGECAETRLGKMLDAKKQTGEFQYPYLANYNVQWFRFDLTNLNKMDFNDKDRIEFALQKGDLLVCEGGEVGRTAIWNEEIKECYFQKALHRIRCNPEKLVPEFLAYMFFLRANINGFQDIVGKSTIPHLTGVKLKKLEVILPAISLQNKFANFVQQADKSKFELKRNIDNLEIAIKTLNVEVFG